MPVMPETIVENCPRQISKVKGGFIMQISKEMLIGELLQVDENMAQILMGAGMHCIGCPSSQMESLEEACMVHGIPVEKLVSTAFLMEFLDLVKAGGSRMTTSNFSPSCSNLGSRSNTSAHWKVT